MITPPISPTAGSPQKSVQWAEKSTLFEPSGLSSNYNGSRESTWTISRETTQVDSEGWSDHETGEEDDEEEEEGEEYVPTVDPSIATVDEDSPWTRRNILSLDGGGVRGYSSLLLLKRLMDEITQIEKKNDPKASTSAFSPLIDTTALFSDPAMKELEGTYRPCHYFDYIAGSSTGGLIAIMLGRLRMTVDECLKLYKDLSETVFEKPSSRWKRSLNKYNSSERRDTLEQLFTHLQPAQPSPSEISNKFKSDSVRCRTIVCSNRSDLNEKISTPFLFRSYEHNTRKTREPYAFERNPGDSPEFDIWQVARATSAAPSYFKSTRLFEYRYFDAAVNMNNPSWEVLNEVTMIGKDHDSIDLLLSLGAGNAKGNTTKAKHTLQKVLNDISDVVHKKVKDASKHDQFDYYRWDVRDGLQDVRLDEWKPALTGEKTLGEIESATNRFLKDSHVQNEIRKCAEALVHSRSLRAQTMRWESYATGTRYRCPIPGCKDQLLRFQNRNDLMDHLQTVHKKAPPDAENFQEIQTLLDQGRTNSE